MNIAELSIKKSVITWTLTVLVLVVGYFSYQNLPRLEDPEFAIKQAVVASGELCPCHLRGRKAG